MSLELSTFKEAFCQRLWMGEEGDWMGRTMEENMKCGEKGYLEMWEDFGKNCENK